jgi:hypothetical protein
MRALAVFAASSLVCAILAAFGTSAALAHPSPAGCNSNSLDVTLRKDRTVVRNGDTSNYEVDVTNIQGLPCDYSDVTVSLTLPASDGSATGQTVTLATSADYPSGTGRITYGPVPYVVNLSPGVSDAIAQVTATGARSLHDAPTDHDVDIRKTVGTTVVQPHLTLTVSATPSSGDAPLQIKYEYTLTNDSSTDVPIGDVVVRDDICRDVTYVSGDGDNDKVIDVGERWTYTCTTTRESPGVVTNHVTATGKSQVDLPGEKDRPVDAAPVSTSVNVTQPPGVTSQPGTPATPGTPGTPTGPQPGGPGAPQQPGAPDQPASGVLGERLASPNAPSSQKNAACISVPKSLRLRARERTTVRVRIAEDGVRAAGALVRIIGPGIRRRKLTNRNGVAIFRVRARRAGRLIIQSNRCLGADRIRVMRARRTSNNQVPRGTG